MGGPLQEKPNPPKGRKPERALERGPHTFPIDAPLVTVLYGCWGAPRLVPGKAGEMADEVRLVITMKDAATFAVEMDVQAPNPEYALLMLDSARRGLEREMRKMEAREVQVSAAQAFAALKKGPGLVR